MSDTKASKPVQMAFNWEAGVKPQGPGARGESLAAREPTERPMFSEHLMEEVFERHNLHAALKQVRANKGSPGVDGMSVDELPDFLKVHWPEIKDQLFDGTYQPQMIKRVEIPKPGSEEKRKLGIPMAYAYCISLPRRLGIAVAAPTSANSLYQLTQYSGLAVADQVDSYKTSG